MTNQELYTKVRRHLLVQGKRSATGLDRCLYRGPDGLKCAIGCLIPDDKYHAELEHSGVMESEIIEAAGLTWEHDQMNLACELQHIHDALSVLNWQCALDRCAEIYSLQIEES